MNENTQSDKWNKANDWFGNGKKNIIGLILFTLGICVRMLSTKTLTEPSFLLLSAGMMCFICALFSKITKTNISLIFFVLFNTVLVAVGISFFYFLEVDSIIPVVLIIVLVLISWMFSFISFQTDSVGRRLIISFLETLCLTICIGAAFFIPILLSVLFE